MGFLEMPIEIRQQILNIAICSRITPPESPSVSQHDRKRLTNTILSVDSIWQRQPENPALPLMLVNKQVFEDVQQVLQHVGTDYHVDIMFVKDHGLWTTWSIPALPRTQYIDSIQATFRIFKPTRDLKWKFSGTLRFGCLPWWHWWNRPLGAAAGFYVLLTESLQSGPGFLKRPKTKFTSCSYSVKRIVVDVLSPTDGVVHRSIRVSNTKLAILSWLPTLSNRPLCDAERDDVQKPPEERLLKYLLWAFESVWSLSFWTLDRGAVLLEGVRDTIDFTVNGKLRKRFNVAEHERMTEEPYFGGTTEYVQKRRELYFKWKTWLDERRKRMNEGLEFDSERPVEWIMISSSARRPLGQPTV